MANYVIDPLNAAEPTDARAAGYAAEELRAMKGILAGLAGSPTAESLVSWKNRFANGGMRFDQTNSSVIVTVNSTANFNSADCTGGSGTASPGTFTMQHIGAGAPPGYSAYVRVTRGTQDASPANGSAYQVAGSIEGLDISDLQWGSANALAVSYQFMFRTSITGAKTWSGSIRNTTVGRSYPVTWTTEAANVWKLITLPNIPGDVTGTWPIDNQRSMLLTIDVGSGADFRGAANAWAAGNLIGVTGTERFISSAAADTFDFTGVQLERGPVCTPFETMPFPAQLSRLQRYLYRSSFIIRGQAITTCHQQIMHPVVMLAAPTVTANGPQYVNASNLLFFNVSTFGAEPTIDVSAVGGFVLTNFTAAARL